MMEKLTTKKLQELIQAEQNKTLQVKTKGRPDSEYYYTGEVYWWDFENKEYRVKPKPQRFFVCTNKDWLLGAGMITSEGFGNDDVVGIALAGNYLPTDQWIPVKQDESRNMEK